MHTEVSEASILDAILKALAEDAGPEDAMTLPEMAKLIVEKRGGSLEYVTRMLRRAIPDSGRYEVIWVRRTDKVGRNGRVPAYRLVA